MNAEVLGQLTTLLLQCLEVGHCVSIERLGVFRPVRSGGFKFIPDERPGVFIAYVEEDLSMALRLYHALERKGFHPWMDRKKLMPGQNWPRAIEGAIETADFFVACFSRRAGRKRGGFQSEMRYALDCARRLPLDQIFILPVRLEECAIPARIRNHLQYTDVFPDFDWGVERLAETMRAEMDARRRAA
jgi:hypothetical protein